MQTAPRLSYQKSEPHLLRPPSCPARIIPLHSFKRLISPQLDLENSNLKIADLLCQVSLVGPVPVEEPAPSILPTRPSCPPQPSYNAHPSHPFQYSSAQQPNLPYPSISQQNHAQAANFASSFFASDTLSSQPSSSSIRSSTSNNQYASSSSGDNTASTAATSIISSSSSFKLETPSSHDLPLPQAREHIKVVARSSSGSSRKDSQGSEPSESGSADGGLAGDGYGEKVAAGARKTKGKAKAKVKKEKIKPARNVFGSE